MAPPTATISTTHTPGQRLSLVPPLLEALDKRDMPSGAVTDGF
jgi:hypothetical protein